MNILASLKLPSNDKDYHDCVGAVLFLELTMNAIEHQQPAADDAVKLNLCPQSVI